MWNSSALPQLLTAMSEDRIRRTEDGRAILTTTHAASDGETFSKTTTNIVVCRFELNMAPFRKHGLYVDFGPWLVNVLQIRFGTEEVAIACLY